MINIIKLSAQGEFQKAIVSTNNYIDRVKIEQENAEEAIKNYKKLLSGIQETEDNVAFTKKTNCRLLEYHHRYIKKLGDEWVIFCEKKTKWISGIH